jgi:hypothetical protein
MCLLEMILPWVVVLFAGWVWFQMMQAAGRRPSAWDLWRLWMGVWCGSILLGVLLGVLLESLVGDVAGFPVPSLSPVPTSSRTVVTAPAVGFLFNSFLGWIPAWMAVRLWGREAKGTSHKQSSARLSAAAQEAAKHWTGTEESSGTARPSDALQSDQSSVAEEPSKESERG